MDPQIHMADGGRDHSEDENKHEATIHADE